MPQAILGREKVDWDQAYSEHGPLLRKIEAAIANNETNNALTLTPDAIEAFLLPFLVEVQRRGEIPQDVIDVTVRNTFTQLVKDPDNRDVGTTRSVFSVIRAWWRAWCDIPPICRATDE